MDRNTAAKFTRDSLDKWSLTEWRVRITADPNASFLGLCVHKDKTIIINAHHVDINPVEAILNTIKHEVAHALTPGHAHDDIWEAKAREVGCTYVAPCSYLSLPDHVIDAFRSGATIEMEIEEVVQVMHKPKFTITQLKDVCPDCGKPAKEKFRFSHIDKNGNEVILITLACFHIIKKVLPKGTPFDLMVSNDWNPLIKNCKHKWNKNQCTECKEYKLFDFQITGARAAESGLSMQKGFGIFDDMGLGKTVQGLAVIKYHPEYTPTLYITKSAITFQWFKQIVRWLGPDYLAQVIKTSKDFIFPNLKSYIISYDLLRRMDRAKIAKLGIKCVILDECQQIKNVDSSRTQEVRRLLAAPDIKVIPLSGTPWKNRGSEFFPVLNMMDPIKFYSNQHFLDTHVDFYFEGTKRKQGGIRNPEKFKEYTQSLLIRREYNEVMDEFPEINRMKLNIQLDELEQTTYDDATSDFVKWYNDAVISGEEDNISGIEILGQMARMRHITGLAKIPATLGFIEEFIENTDRKLVVFVHHKDVGELMYQSLTQSSKEWSHLQEELVSQGIKVLKYTSELSDSERFEMQELFNSSKRAIMIASTLACGEGVDLQTCSDSVLHERQWNPQNEDQATPGRFRRIGQLAKHINNTVPEAEGTIDEHLDYLVSAKRSQFHAVMNKGAMPTWNQGDFAKDLAKLIVAKFKDKKKSSKSITKQAALPKKRITNEMSM